jgi:hypothetical protein
MAETDVASTITPSVSTAVTYAIAPATPVASVATQVFNPLYGYRVSDPLYLTGTAVTGSVIRWTVTAGSAGSAYLVETSIDGGATWDKPTNGGTIPRLLSGNTATVAVLTRVTMSRLLSSDTSPRMTSLEVQVSCDASVDETVPIGHGPIVSVKAKIGPSSGGDSGGSGVWATGGGQTGTGPSLKIKAIDPSRAISKNPWEKPYTVVTQPYDQAAVGMVTNRLPTQEDFSVVSVNRNTDLLIYGLGQATDSWQDIRDLATACGCEAFFDAAGVFVFRPVTDPRITPAVWTFDDGALCTVTEVERELSDDSVFNYVVVKGESTSSQNAVSAVAFDNDPASPTYVYGRFGQHPIIVTLPSVTTVDQAQQAANAILYGSLGASETVTITCVPVPFLECGDVVTVSIGDVKADGRYKIQQMTTPLSPGAAQTLTCFRQSAQE